MIGAVCAVTFIATARIGAVCAVTFSATAMIGAVCADTFIATATIGAMCAVTFIATATIGAVCAVTFVATATTGAMCAVTFVATATILFSEDTQKECNSDFWCEFRRNDSKVFSVYCSARNLTLLLTKPSLSSNRHIEEMNKEKILHLNTEKLIL
jgi:hypothetical protein